MGRAVETVRLYREGRAVVCAQVDIRFLACANQIADLRREARVEDRLRGPAVSAFAQVDRPMVNAPLDARVQGRIVRHFSFMIIVGGRKTSSRRR